MRALAITVGAVGLALVGAVIAARMERRFMLETLIGGSEGRDVLVLEPYTVDPSDTIDWRRA